MMNSTRDQFGRPARTPQIGVIAVLLTIAFPGSAWPLSLRSVTPPFDTDRGTDLVRGTVALWGTTGSALIAVPTPFPAPNMFPRRL